MCEVLSSSDAGRGKVLPDSNWESARVRRAPEYFINF